MGVGGLMRTPQPHLAQPPAEPYPPSLPYTPADDINVAAKKVDVHRDPPPPPKPREVPVCPNPNPPADDVNGAAKVAIHKVDRRARVLQQLRRARHGVGKASANLRAKAALARMPLQQRPLAGLLSSKRKGGSGGRSRIGALASEIILSINKLLLSKSSSVRNPAPRPHRVSNKVAPAPAAGLWPWPFRRT